jgi:CBS-domain-containing membrane protein
MTTIAEIMSRDVQTIAPEDTLRKAAEQLRELDVGSLPVTSGTRLLGMLTDRDIAVRGVAEGLDPQQACVSDVMTQQVQCCGVDDEVQAVMQKMGTAQLRRMPVVNSNQELVGIVALADLALKSGRHIDDTVRKMSQPG